MTDIEHDATAAIPLKRTARDPERVRTMLGQWLAPRVGAGRDLTVSPLTTPGGTGVANETLLFEATWTSQDTVRTEGFVARVASERPLYIDADIELHAKTYQALAGAPGVPVPLVYGYEADPGLLGAPFFVMERIVGQVPADQPHWQAAGFVHDASPARRRAMWDNAVAVLAALHQVAADRFGHLAPAPGMNGAADNLRYWRRTLDTVSATTTWDTLEEGHQWLVAHLPPDAPTGFSWGDSRFPNVMFRDDRVVAIFDWDTASMAGAEADLAWWRYMDGPAAELSGIGTADELVVRWEELTGRRAMHLAWYDVFTTFRLGVIMVRLFGHMAADGILPADVAAQQSRESAPALALAAHLRTMG